MRRMLTSKFALLSFKTGVPYMFSIHIHPEAHPEPSFHVSTKESEAGKGSSSRELAPASVASNATDFSADLAAGKHSGLLGHLPPIELTAVTLPGDPNRYFAMSTSKLSRPQALYIRDIQTGVLKQTSKQVLADGHGGWKLDAGLPGGGQVFSRARSRPPLSDEQKQQAIAQANAAHKRAQSELSEAREKLKNAEQDLKMIEQTHGQRDDLWRSLTPPEENVFRPASPQDRARHELRRPAYPQQWAPAREWLQENTAWPTSFKPGKERAQAEDAIAKARLQIAAAQKKVDDANQALLKAMGKS
jgi:hypothetical protein